MPGADVRTIEGYDIKQVIPVSMLVTNGTINTVSSGKIPFPFVLETFLVYPANGKRMNCRVCISDGDLTGGTAFLAAPGIMPTYGASSVAGANDAFSVGLFGPLIQEANFGVTEPNQRITLIGSNVDASTDILQGFFLIVPIYT